MSKERMTFFATAGLVGALLVGLALAGRSKADTTRRVGGIEALVTPHHGCESIEWDGKLQMRCDDGFEVEVALPLEE